MLMAKAVMAKAVNTRQPALRRWVLVSFSFFLLTLAIDRDVIDIERLIYSGIPDDKDAARFRPILMMLSAYRRKHELDAIKRLSGRELCAKQWYVARFSCKDAGNGIGHFLDNLAWAIIFDQTIVVHWNPRACADTLGVRDWIINSTTLDDMQERADCSRTIKPLRMKGDSHVMGCCNIESLSSPFLSPGKVFVLPQKRIGHFAFERLRPVEGTKNIVSRSARERAATLFESSWRNLSSYDVFGLLTMLSVRFNPYMMEVVDPALPEGASSSTVSEHQPREVMIGLHIRHQKKNKDYELMIDDLFESCLRDKVQLLLPTLSSKGSARKSEWKRSQAELRSAGNDQAKSGCSLLIATDRLHTMKRFKKIAESLGCAARFVAKEDLKSKFYTGLPIGEHGPWNQNGAPLFDYYLLTHAHYFFGTKISSFSMLMLNMITVHAMLRGEKKPFAWGVQIESDFQHEINSCTEYVDEAPHAYAKQDIKHCSSPDAKESYQKAFYNASTCTYEYAPRVFHLPPVDW